MCFGCSVLRVPSENHGERDGVAMHCAVTSSAYDMNSYERHYIVAQSAVVQFICICHSQMFVKKDGF
jgi:hypothetical protein